MQFKLLHKAHPFPILYAFPDYGTRVFSSNKKIPLKGGISLKMWLPL
jgi:hypothetical protein